MIFLLLLCKTNAWNRKLTYQEELVKCCEGNNSSYVEEAPMTWDMWTRVYYLSNWWNECLLCCVYELTLWNREIGNCLEIQQVSWLGKIAFGEKRQWCKGASKEVCKGKATAITKKEGDGIPWDKCYVSYLSFIMPCCFNWSMVINLYTLSLEKSLYYLWWKCR